MDEERRKQLESKFEAIKELKNELYIGSGDAFKYLKKENEIYIRPVEIAQGINLELKKIGLEELTYKATPERVYFLTRLFLELRPDFEFEELPSTLHSLTELLEEILEKDSLDKKEKDREFEKRMPWYYLGKFQEFYFLRFVSIFERLKFQKEATKILTPFFERANKNRAKDDFGLAEGAAEIISSKYESIRPKIEEDMIDYCDSYIEKFVKNIKEANLEDYIENEGFTDFIERQKYEARSNSRYELGVHSIANRLFGDQIDHRLEYRRMVLAKWLTDEAIKDHENALEIIQKSIEYEREENEYDKPNEKANRIRNLEFIRFLIRTDKNFIEKYLRS